MANRTHEKECLVEVRCGICGDVYSDPVMTPCLHSFCKSCIAKQLEEKGTSSNGSFRCPTCSVVSLLPDGGVKDFPSNLWLAHQATAAVYQQKIESGGHISCDRCRRSSGPAAVYCSNCCRFMCLACEDDHKWTLDTDRHELVSIGQKRHRDTVDFAAKFARRAAMCPTHVREEMRYYCIDCNSLVCCNCVVMEHSAHECSYLSEEVGNKQKEELGESVKELESTLTTLEAAIESVEKEKQEVDHSKELRKKEITKRFEDYHRALSARERVLLQKCDKVAVQKQNLLSRQSENIQSVRDKVAFTSQFTLSTCSYSASEFLITKKFIQQCARDRLKSSRCLVLKPYETGAITVEFDTSVHKLISQLGCVTEVCDPARCTVEEGMAIPMASVGKKRKVKISLRSSEGNIVQSEVPVSAVLEAKSGECFQSVKIKHDFGYAVVSFQPQKVGEYLLNIKVNDSLIMGSPYKLWSRLSPGYKRTKLLSENISTFAESICCIAVHPDSGDVYASCEMLGHVQVYSKDGIPRVKIGAEKSEDDQQFRPWGIALVEEVLYVADCNNHCVRKFKVSNNEYMGQFGSQGSNNGQFCYPCGLCSDGSGHVLVADYGNSRVQIFNVDSTFAASFHCDGLPQEVAVDNESRIHVIMESSKSVSVFSFDGQRLSTYSAGLKIKSITGITLDENGYKFLCDPEQRRVNILNKAGCVVSSCSFRSSPYCVTMDTHGVLYVAFEAKILKYMY